MPVEPNIFDDAKLASARADQEDPIIQYYIVKKDLNMSAGKACAQVAHGAMMFLLRYNEIAESYGKHPYEDEINTTSEWINGSFRKVVLSGTAKDFDRIKTELKCFVVRDAGLTQVDPGSETVLVLWPMKKSRVPKFLSRLRVY